MALKVEALPREFVNSKTKQTLPDPDPNMPPEKVREFYSNQYPELVNCSIKGPEIQKTKIKFTFSTVAGVKG